MKKQYHTPSINTMMLHTVNLLATSVPVSGTTDDEARSRKFWGKSMFEEQEDDTEETDSWY